MSRIAKNFLLVFILPFIVFVSNDDDTVRFRLTENNSTLYVNWFIENEYELIQITIFNNGEESDVTLDDNEGYQPICCFYGEIRGTLTVLLTSGEIVTLSDSIFIDPPEIEFPPVPTTNIRPTTTTTPTTSTTIFFENSIDSSELSNPEPIATPEEFDIRGNLNLDNIFNFENVTIDNEILSKIPTFEEINFSDNTANTKANINTLLILILFYLVLALQEWLNKQINDYDFKFLKRDKTIDKYKSGKIIFGILAVGILIAFVEEGAEFVLSVDNLLLLISTIIALVLAVFFYDLIELFQEVAFLDSKYSFDWSPQAIFFSIFSFFIFVFFDLPVGFLFGYVVVLKIHRQNNSPSRFSPKILSILFTIFIGYTAIYLTTSELVGQNILFSTTMYLLFLFTIEGAFFKSLPIGGNEYLESFRDSFFFGKLIATLSVVFAIWSFIRLIVIPTDGEVANFNNEIVQMGEYAVYFSYIVGAYALIVLVIGLSLITFGEKSNS